MGLSAPLAVCFMVSVIFVKCTDEMNQLKPGLGSLGCSCSEPSSLELRWGGGEDADEEGWSNLWDPNRGGCCTFNLNTTCLLWIQTR